MKWYSHAVVALALSAFVSPALAEEAAAPAPAPDGEAIYMKKCKVCHGKDGTATKAGLKKKSPENLYASLSTWQFEAVVENITKGKNKMPTFGPREGKKAKLTPEEINAVAKYVFDLKK